MQKTSVTLSVFHDGQFFTALFERMDESGYSVARRRFGQKPSDLEIMELVLDKYARLHFSDANVHETMLTVHKNPKRRQREATKAMRCIGTSTKAQAALSTECERCKIAKKVKSSAGKKRLRTRNLRSGKKSANKNTEGTRWLKQGTAKRTDGMVCSKLPLCYAWVNSSSVSLSTVTEYAMDGPPPNATATIAASMISSRVAPALSAWLTW